MDMQKNLTISILGKSYSLSTDENADLVFQAAQKVDKMLRDKIDKVGKAISEEKLAVIVALELATELAKQNEALASFEQKALDLDSLLDQEL